ncbi:MAG: TauD/TfdA family dioxygenase [Gammaproteobacteria bacterium]|nr:TauD/TfdA family dioxygenase [Gammaproteobacteria bacterium]
MLTTLENPIHEPNLRREYSSFAVRALTPHLGAEIRDIDLSKPLSNEQAADLHTAWLDWKVLVFRDQHLSRDDHKQFARRFGDLHTHPLRHNSEGDKEILPVKTTADSPYTAGDGWHTDVTCDEVPPLGSMLYLTETPKSGGGNTMFADMYLAYELLSDPMKAFLEDLSAIHDGGLPYVGSYGTDAPEGGYPCNEHPVVTRHPETGQKVLYVNSGFTSRIVGLTHRESQGLLDILFRHIDSTARLYCQVEWEPNTLTFWDNRCTQHHAVWDYYPHSRYGERVSIVGGPRPAR